MATKMGKCMGGGGKEEKVRKNLCTPEHFPTQQH